jgi:hypothetical protein
MNRAFSAGQSADQEISPRRAEMKSAVGAKHESGKNAGPFSENTDAKHDVWKQLSADPSTTLA